MTVTPEHLSAPRFNVPPPSTAARRTGLFLSGFAALFLLFDGAVKLWLSPEAISATEQLGFPVSVVFYLGILEFAMLALYLFPRTAVFGAVLWTGYLGGAISVHVSAGTPLFTHVLFPVYVACLLWGGLALRDKRVRALRLDLFGA